MNRKYSVAVIVQIIMMMPYLTLNNAVIAQEPSISIDGEIGVDEYEFTLSLNFGRFLLYWENVGQEIYFGISAMTKGYVGINVDPGEILTDADLLYGYVDGSEVGMLDTYSDALFGPPKLDVDDGGTDDILEFSGNQDGGTTVFEFRRLLTTADSHDNEISLNGTLIAWTTGESDDYLDRPDDSGRVMINFVTGESKEVTDYTIYYIIGGGVLVLLTLSFIIFKLVKRRRG